MSKTYKKLKMQTQKLNRLEQSLAIEREKHRKKDTRNKIQLGGLVIKAGIHNLPKATILGILIEAKEKLDDNPELCSSHWQRLGDQAFNESKS